MHSSSHLLISNLSILMGQTVDFNGPNCRFKHSAGTTYSQQSTTKTLLNYLDQTVGFSNTAFCFCVINAVKQSRYNNAALRKILT